MTIIATAGHSQLVEIDGNLVIIDAIGEHHTFEAVEALETGDEYWPRGLTQRAFNALQNAAYKHLGLDD